MNDDFLTLSRDPARSMGYVLSDRANSYGWRHPILLSGWDGAEAAAKETARRAGLEPGEHTIAVVNMTNAGAMKIVKVTIPSPEPVVSAIVREAVSL